MSPTDQIVRDALDREIAALATRKRQRRRAFADVAAEARVEVLAQVLARIETDGRSGYAGTLGRATERVLGERISYVGSIVGRRA